MGYSRFDRPTAQRKALLRGLVTSLLENERIETTLAKAKELQPIAEKMITIAKKDTLAARRQALAYITDEDTVTKLFETIGPRYAHRQGGYTRIIQTGQRRGDGSPMAILGSLSQRNRRLNGTMNVDASRIEIKGLTHTYQVDESHSVMALSGVDLAIDEGEFLVILGPNGSGKSTLAKHLNALLLPDEGDVWVFGMNTKNPEFTWEIRKNAGMVFQNPDNQLVATVVEEDVAFGPENLGVEPKEIRERVARALESVGMTKFAHHAPHFLSGGQKQRVAIAGILAMEPKCVILDEPTAMLDPIGREEVMETITRLNREMGITIVHITHYMDEALYADRVVVMNEGKIVMQGTPREVFEEEETLSALGLDVPPVGKLAHMLASSGIGIDPGALNVDELVDELCQLK